VAEIHDAVIAGDAARVRELVAGDPSVGRARDADGVSAILLALYRSSPETLAPLLEAEPELDVFEAAAVGRAARVRELVDADPALVDAGAPDGFWPLGLAAFFGHEEVVADLLGRGADPSRWSRHATIVVQGLHAAAANGSAAIAERLLDAGAPASEPQPGGFTAVHAAAAAGNDRLARLLLERGADREARTAEGKSPADLARERGAASLAALLEPSGP
jgi:ankyrin repeat protein